MKKKNVLMMALSLCLVAVVAIGGTLAYLTAAPDQVTNTFTFVQGGDDPEAPGVINVKLTESNPNEDKELMGVASATQNKSDGGYDYVDVVPNQVLPKDPTVGVKTKVDSWVFVKVVESDYVKVVENGIDTKKWTVLDAAEGIYGYANMVPANYESDWTDLPAVFTQVQVSNDVDPADVVNGDLGEVVVYVAAIQNDASFESVADAYEAFQTEGGTFVSDQG